MERIVEGQEIGEVMRKADVDCQAPFLAKE